MGEVFRSGFIMRAGPSFNDFVTPAVVSAASDDYRRNLANTLTLLAMVNGDAASGAANKKIMTGWLAKYLPLCLDATAQLKPVWMTTGARGADFGSALADAKTKFSEILAEIDVSLPTGTAL